MRHSGGQAIITAVVFFLIISITISIGVINPVLRSVKQADEFARSHWSFNVAQAVSEDAIYRLKNGKQFISPSTLTINGYSATASSTSVVGGIQINSSANASSLVRSIQTHLSNGSGASFNYGVQIGEGGLRMKNTSSVRGNIFSNGPIRADDKNVIKGDVISAGSAGLLDNVHATSSAYAHDIEDSTIDKDAYYQTIFNTTVAGVSHPGSADQAPTALPVSDSQIADWEAAAEDGGVISSPCPYKINSDVTIGPVKIDCDLVIEKNKADVSLAGPVWVSGNITVTNEATVRVVASLASSSAALIADKLANRLTSSFIDMQNRSTYYGSGTVGSYLLMVSMNESAVNGGDEKAIETRDDAHGQVIVYAPYGFIVINKHAEIKEVTGYKVEIRNDAEIVYETGVANMLFSAGPAGGYVLDKWREVQ